MLFFLFKTQAKKTDFSQTEAVLCLYYTHIKEADHNLDQPYTSARSIISLPVRMWRCSSDWADNTQYRNYSIRNLKSKALYIIAFVT